MTIRCSSGRHLNRWKPLNWQLWHYCEASDYRQCRADCSGRQGGVGGSTNTTAAHTNAEQDRCTGVQCHMSVIAYCCLPPHNDPPSPTSVVVSPRIPASCPAAATAADYPCGMPAVSGPTLQQQQLCYCSCYQAPTITECFTMSEPVE